MTKTTIIETVYDVGIKLDDPGFGTKDAWEHANQFLSDVAERFGLEDTSAGTGFGVRDCQMVTSDHKSDHCDAIRTLAEDSPLGIDLDYVSRYYQVQSGPNNEWVCPKCRGTLDEVQIERREGSIGEEKVYWFSIALECPTCPDVLSIVVTIPGHEPEET